VRPPGIVEADDLGEGRSQVPLVEGDEMIRALPAEGPDHPFRDGVRPGRPDRAEQRREAQAPRPPRDVAAADGVPVARQVARLPAPGRRLEELPPDPGRGGMGGDVRVHQLAATAADEQLNRGTNLSVVQDLPGHASPETTKRIYATTDRTVLRAARAHAPRPGRPGAGDR
jgi:hypothetical protein